MADYETLRVENAALQEKIKTTEALLIALQHAYKTKTDELESLVKLQYRLSEEEEAEQRQSVVVGSGRNL
jgi:hypothetical protein